MAIQYPKEETTSIQNSDDLYEIMQKVLWREERIEQNREHFWIIGLDNNNRILFIELIGLGTVNTLLVEPMEVFSLALQKRAVKLILCHSHLSGALDPSDKDKDITDRLIQVGRIVHLPVLDHLIISANNYLSFESIGLMEELSRSLKYVPAYQQAERMREIAHKIADEMFEARQSKVLEEKIKAAKIMKKDGLDTAIISKYTGLSTQEVEQL